MYRILILIVVVVLVLGGLFFALRPAPREEAAVPQESTVDIDIQGDAMNPSAISVGEGDMVNLNITADRPIEFHTHGYDLEEEVTPEEPAEISFIADLTGRFEIEDEETQTELGTLIVEPR